MTERPTLKEIEAAARVLDKHGRAFGWWKGKSYDEVAATDSIGKSEIDGIVEQMLMAASSARGTLKMHRLGDSVSGALRTFGFWLANGTVGLPILEGVDYSCIFREPSALETAMGIYANVLRIDESGRVLNPRAAEMRAAQWIRMYVDPTYIVDPPFEGWECVLHDPSTP